MGDPRGFLKVRTRRELAERPVEERIKDWFDVHAESGLQPWTTMPPLLWTKRLRAAYATRTTTVTPTPTSPPGSASDCCSAVGVR